MCGCSMNGKGEVMVDSEGARRWSQLTAFHCLIREGRGSANRTNIAIQSLCCHTDVMPYLWHARLVVSAESGVHLNTPVHAPEDQLLPILVQKLINNAHH